MSQHKGKMRIKVDGKTYEVRAGENLLQACLSKGLDLPYFCWHPALGSVGACRQCAVKTFQDDKDQHGKIVMSCMTPVTDGARLSIVDDEASRFRDAVVEFLMVNHPHDCAVCEEGGECHLQDMTVMTGHARRRYRYSKRTHKNQNLGPFIGHEMNRCIACYRCVRYYRDYAGGDDLNVFGAHDNVYFGRVEDGPLENEFSGNLVEVCPTGVFTDKTLGQRYTRKWDLQTAPSICAHCSVGCNTSPGERYGELRRISNRYHGEINDYFLCDRGRFGYGHVNRGDRPRQFMLRLEGNGAGLQAVDAAAGLRQIRELLKDAKRVVGIGSPRASLEANFALRELVGAGNYYSGMSSTEQLLAERILQILRDSPAPVASLRSMAKADAVLLLGEDVTNSAPRVALALRQAVNSGARAVAADRHIPPWQADAVATAAQGVEDPRRPFFSLTPMKTRLDELATEAIHLEPDLIARMGQAIAHKLGVKQSKVTGLKRPQRSLVKQIAAVLADAKRVVIVSGTGCGDAGVIEAAANIAWALKSRGIDAELSYALPEANSLGVAMLEGGSMDEVLGRMGSGAVDAAIVLENDLYRRAPATTVDMAIDYTPRLIVLDHQQTTTGAKALALLPAASFAEGDGTLVNQETRAQRFFQVYEPRLFDPQSAIAESWRWLQALAGSEVWRGLDDVTAACATALPKLAGILDAAPHADQRITGQRVPRMSHRSSGRTAMLAGMNIHEPRQPRDADSALAFTMEGYAGQKRPAAVLPMAWSPGWNSSQAWNKFQDEIGGALRGGDSGVRLVRATGQASYYFPVREAVDETDGLQIIPLPQIFGGEELSARAAPIRARQPAGFAAINSALAERMGFEEGNIANLQVDGRYYSLPVNIRDDIPAGWLGIPVGLDDVPVYTAAGMPVELEAAEELEL